MSSKNQYKDALKRQKQINSKLKDEIIGLKQSNTILINLNKILRQENEKPKPQIKWWQFWRYL